MADKRLILPLLVLACLLGTPAAFAHPMGNFSVNHYSKITLRSDRIDVEYIIDLAEIPTYQELQEGKIAAQPGAPGVALFLARRGEALRQGLLLTVNGKPLALRMVSKQVIFPPGAGGLPTMKMGFVYRADYPPNADRTSANLQYADRNFPGHSGWKEIVVNAPAGSLLASSVPQTDRSAELSNYPTELLSSPPQDLDASIQFKNIAAPQIASTPLPPLRSAHATSSIPVRPAYAPRASSHAVGHPAMHETGRQAEAPPAPQPVASASAEPLHLKANRQATPRSAFTELISTEHLSFWFLFTAALIAAGLGALHALEPGHGKTIVAAYLVGSRGTARHAVLLGIIVTASHTAGVFALGAITLYASRYIVPEQLYPWLGVLSGLTIAGLGGYMLLRRWTGLDIDHAHVAGQLHSHWFPSKKEPLEELAEARTAMLAPSAQNKTGGQSVSLYQLFTLGITGGIIPCPAALVVLLSAFALHRIGLGFFLIVTFSVGLATVLIGFGMLMVYARRFMAAHMQIDGPLTKRWLPVASAAFMTTLGAVIAIRAFMTTGLNLHMLSKEKLGPALFVGGLGLVLGMRHSTDPDHVVAVSTIVSKQRSVRYAALIGTIWGFGHTLTIFVVGCLIILFGVVIPPRLGLSMEFSVGLMLILLGVLNLTGVMQKITTHFSLGSRTPNRTPIPSNPSITKTGAERMLDRSVGRFGLYQMLRPLIIGIVHGLAGSAAVALLVLSTIHSPLWATVYLLIFGVGTMIGMMCMTAIMAAPLAYAGNRFTQVSRYLTVASGLVSVCFGAFLVYQLGFVGGLFTSHPQWTPR